MKKLLSLIKAVMSSDMSIFKIKTKKEGKKKSLLPFILAILFMFYIWMYANMLMDQLVPIHAEIVLLTIFVLLTSILTLIEGIYKSGNLLFNCKDDDLLLSLPLKKSTVLFIRIFKFYIFELLYNSLFLIPGMLVYIRYVHVGLSFYLISLLMLFLLPIIPVVLSVVIGLFISNISTRFKHKNLFQIIITMAILFGVFYFATAEKDFMANIATHATSINEFILKIYYPAGVYLNSITNINVLELLIFIVINIVLFAITIVILSNIYFKTNSRSKEFSTSKKKNTNYVINTRNIRSSLVKKEFGRFISSPVFVTNAGFGLILYVVACILFAFKFDSIANMLVSEESGMTIDMLNSIIPAITFGLIGFGSFMSMISCSMISLEGRNINILKSLPVKPMTIITSKVLMTLYLMIPFIFIGDIIIFIRFKFSIIDMILLLLSSVVLPLLTELIGIIANLKYPKMDAANDSEVVKQSTSTMISTFIGMILVGVTFLGVLFLTNYLNTTLVILLGLMLYSIISGCLLLYLNKKGTKLFNDINV